MEEAASSSKSICEMIKGSHRYTVQGYSLLKGMGPGKFISSDVFTVGGYDWAIRFYPDGFKPEHNSMYISVYVSMNSDVRSVKAMYTLTLIDQSGRGKHNVFFDQNPAATVPCVFKRGAMWGTNRLMLRSDLEASDFLKDDCLEFDCCIGVVLPTRNDRPNFSINVPPPNLGYCLKGILESGTASDIIFEVGGERFHAHKSILAARSPVFCAQFFGLIGNTQTNRVVVNEIDPSIFKAMLDFIYSDSFPNSNEFEGTSASYLLFVQNLLAAADLYGLDRLKLLCEFKLSEEVTPGTVANTLVLAEKHSCWQLKSFCLQFAALPSNIKGFIDSEGYQYLEEFFPTLISEVLQIVSRNGDPMD